MYNGCNNSGLKEKWIAILLSIAIIFTSYAFLLPDSVGKAMVAEAASEVYTKQYSYVGKISDTFYSYGGNLSFHKGYLQYIGNTDIGTVNVKKEPKYFLRSDIAYGVQNGLKPVTKSVTKSIHTYTNGKLTLTELTENDIASAANNNGISNEEAYKKLLYTFYYGWQGPANVYSSKKTYEYASNAYLYTAAVASQFYDYKNSGASTSSGNDKKFFTEYVTNCALYKKVNGITADYRDPFKLYAKDEDGKKYNLESNPAALSTPLNITLRKNSDGTTSYRTKKITLTSAYYETTKSGKQVDTNAYIYFYLPAYCNCVVTHNGKTTTYKNTTAKNGSDPVKVYGGDTFYLTANDYHKIQYSYKFNYKMVHGRVYLLKSKNKAYQTLAQVRYTTSKAVALTLTVSKYARFGLYNLVNDEFKSSVDYTGSYSRKGAVYTVYTNENATVPLKKSNGENVTITMGDSAGKTTGYVQISDSHQEYYYIKQTAAPNGFALDPVIHRVMSQDTGASRTYYESYNGTTGIWPKSYSDPCAVFKITKQQVQPIQNSDGTAVGAFYGLSPLKGTEYNVYAAFDSATGEVSNPVKTVTGDNLVIRLGYDKDKNGAEMERASGKNIGTAIAAVNATEYYIKETKSGHPAWDLDNTVYSIGAAADKTSSGMLQFSEIKAVYTEKTAPAIINAKAKDTNNLYTYNSLYSYPADVLIQTLPASDGKTADALKDTVFTVKYYNYPSAKGDRLQRIWRLKADENGNVRLQDDYRAEDDYGQAFYVDESNAPVIPAGTVTVQMSSVADGYNFDGTAYEIVRNNDNNLSDVNKDESLNIENTVLKQIVLTEADFKLSSSLLRLNIGSTYTLTCELPQENPVTYSSSDISVATVNEQTGEVAAVSQGQAVITCTANDGTSSSCVVFVYPQTITLNQTEVKLNVGKQQQLSYTPSNDIYEAVFTSDNSDVATVDAATGKITAVSVGTATITCTLKTGDDGKTVSTDCTVYVYPSSIELNETSLKLDIGEKYKLEYAPADSICNAVFTSSNTSVAEVDRETGLVTAVSAGEATVTCTLINGVKASCRVYVYPSAITLNKSSLTLGTTEAYTIKYSPASQNYGAVYTSSNTKIAKVDAVTGKVTAVKSGTATITCTLANGVKASCKLTVKSLPSKISYKNSERGLLIGKTATYTPTLPDGTYSLYKTYTSSNTSVATIDKNGTVTAKKRGKTTITCTINANGQKASFTLYVYPSTYKIDAPYINQNKSGLPTGCETVSVVMQLQYYGYSITPAKFADKYLICKSLSFGSDGTIYGADPNSAFIGDPAELGLSFGAYAPVMAKAMNKYLVNAKKKAVVLQNKSLSYLCTKYISQGHPVAIWATSDNMTPSEKTLSWTIDYTDENAKYKKGSKYTWISHEHCLLLVGYDNTYYYFNDPLEKKLTKYKRSVVEARYKEFFSQAIVVVNK